MDSHLKVESWKHFHATDINLVQWQFSFKTICETVTQVNLNPGLGLKFPTVRKCSLSLCVILLHVMWLFYKENVIVAYEQSKVVGYLF